MTRWEKWIAALVGSLVLCVAGFLILKYGVVASREVWHASDGQHEPFCYPPPRRRAGTVLEVSPTRLMLDEGKDRMGRDSSISIGFVCRPSACAQLQGVAKGDKVEAIFGATSVSGGRPLKNELLEIRVGEPENRDTDFEPAPCLGAAEVTAASLMRQKDTAPWPKTGVFAGYYRQQFEVSDFRPTGTSERWWVWNKAGGSGFGAMCGMSDPCYLVVRGELSGQGWHGHMSAYNRELRVIEVIEKRVLTPDEKSPFKSPF